MARNGARSLLPYGPWPCHRLTGTILMSLPNPVFSAVGRRRRSSRPRIRLAESKCIYLHIRGLARHDRLPWRID